MKGLGYQPAKLKDINNIFHYYKKYNKQDLIQLLTLVVSNIFKIASTTMHRKSDCKCNKIKTNPANPKEH